MEGFMLIATSSGKIVYVSDTVEKLLGHSQLDLMGQSLYTICHNGDTELLRHHLQPSKPFDPKGMQWKPVSVFFTLSANVFVDEVSNKEFFAIK